MPNADAGLGHDAARPPIDATDASVDPISEAPTLGSSRATAIEVCMPSGQVAYLSRLRCAGDAVASFERIGHDGYRTARVGEDDYRLSAEQVRTRRLLAAGEKDLHPVDRYAVTCPGEAGARQLYFDMYHCAEGAQTAEPPVGFSLAPVAATAAEATPAPKK